MPGDMSAVVPQPIYISSLMSQHGGLGRGSIVSGLTPSSNAWPLANLAIYIPLLLPGPYTCRRIGWGNGSTVAATNHIDVGVFSEGGTKILSSGSTAQGTASSNQAVALGTPVNIPAGRYWWGMSCDNVLATFRSFLGTAAAWRMLPALEQATAFALPATITPAVMARTIIPILWMSDHPSL